ncbi:MAG TPA: iron ABC transporter permease [Vicinamibacterales bacterium]|jgi:iron complex transport system permease protein|nr:iron ABC transporter permease [Vicinamibacterales bacterium]
MGDVLVTGRSSHTARWVVVFAVAFCAAALLLPFVGPFGLNLERVRARQEPDWSILVQLRVSRTLLGLFAGGALSLAGALFQAMLRDALATPYTLGISAGASLGAVVAIWLGWQQIAGIPAIWVAALAGAAIVLALVVGAALQQRRVSSFSLLLSGLAANSVCSALIIVMYGMVSATKSFSISRWLIGSVDSVDYAALGGFVAVIALAAAVVMRQAKSWNLMAVDPSWAATRGARVTQLTLSGYGAGSLLTAATVALTGPIGFVGLVVPHLIRTRIGADHRVLLPCAFLGGGVLLAVCDAIGRVVIAPSEIPAGAVMAILGGPYLVWVLRQRAAL